jgi:radical SAM superfamily enzyme YgiQ (UPF0313 family)
MSRKEHYDVVLVQPGVIWVYDPYEHLGLAYLAAALRAAGLKVKIVDAVLERLRMSDLYDELDRYDISVLGVTLVSHGYLVTEKFLQHYRDRHPGTRIVGGGHFATFAAEKIFDHTDAFDAVVLGEGELSFVAYCRAVLEGGDERAIPDVAVPGQSVRRSFERIVDMDALPFPARDNLALAMQRGATPSVTASRGCYARCSFCTVASFYDARNGPRWMGRSIDHVIAELTELHGRFGIEHFMFVDDNFMGPGRRGRERALAFANAYASSGLPMTFHVDMRSVDVHDEVIAALVDVGLKSVFIGIESVSEDDLKLYRKDLPSRANWQAVRILDKYELDRTLSMIMFNPATTEASIIENCRFLNEVDYFPRNPIMILNIYEGTEHSRVYADRLQGPFWDYRFDFDRPSVMTVYEHALAFCRDTLPLERELSRRPGNPIEERDLVYQLRLGCLEDLARHAADEPAEQIVGRWHLHLEALRLRLGAGATAATARLFGEASTSEADDFEAAKVGATPELL